MQSPNARRVRGFFAAESGATVIEYALLLGIIALGIVVSLSSITDWLNLDFNNVKDALSK